ncbi:hypothetical protein [Phosphitispora sp. TUW77]|uniref:hypothetical protein n=1 Tax=Phosphitispora sp. TUW77 TaxID=3152361 RepID=UPI003AB5839F
MFKRIMLVVIIMVSGLLTGYYSQPVYNIIWSGIEKIPGVFKDAEDHKGRAGNAEENTDKYIPAEEAVSAVKNIPWVNNLIRVSELDGTELIFEIECEPSDDCPIWLVEVTERFPDRVPETKYFQVAAESGRALDVQEKDLIISGISLGMTRDKVKEAAGSPKKTWRKWDNLVRQTLRTDTYTGMEVVYDKNDVVVKVAASEQGFSGPGGVEVGDSKQDIIRKLGKAGSVQTNLWTYTVLDKDCKLFLDINGECRVTVVTICSGLLD